MAHLNLDSLPANVRDFVLSLPAGEETVLESGGKPVAHVRTPVADPSGEWSDAKNACRFELIDREIAGTLTADEAVELEDLQDDLRRYRRRVAPLPLGETRRLLDELERKAARASA